MCSALVHHGEREVRAVGDEPVDTAGHMLTDVPLRTGLTPAVVIGPAIKIVLGWGSLVALIAAGVGVLVRGRTNKTPAPEGTGV